MGWTGRYPFHRINVHERFVSPSSSSVSIFKNYSSGEHSCEISASFKEYSGQILRRFAVGIDSTPLYKKLHSVAETAFNEIVKMIRTDASASELVQADKVEENSGFTIFDDLIHVYGGG